MGTVKRVFVGIAVIVGILFGLCVLMGACGYRVHGSVTDHGKKLIGFEHKAGYQGDPNRRHHH
jgi:hypothetical protein